MSKRLIIIQSINNFNRLENILTPSCDILALSQKALYVLDKKNLSYKDFDDFYSIDQYINDMGIFHEKVDVFLESLDVECGKGGVNFPYAYSGNEHYLLTLLDDLFYLEKLIQIIQDRYAEVYLFAEQEPQKILNNHLLFSELNSRKVNGTISIPLERLTKRRMQIIYNCIDVHFVRDVSSEPISIPTIVKVKRFKARVDRYIDRTIKYNKTIRCTSDLVIKKKVVYIIQDGYEVSILKRYLTKFRLLNVITKIRQETACIVPLDMPSVPVEGILLDFTDSNFHFLGEYIRIIMMSYHKEVVGRINFFKEKFDQVIQRDRPVLLLYALGTRDVFDTVSCYVANSYDIPVIFFQHGGHCLFGLSLGHQSIEYNLRVLKTLIINSSAELNAVQNDKTRALSLGSMRHYELNKKTVLKPTNEIMYCLGPDVKLNFRELVDHYSEVKKHRNSMHFMSIVNYLDIKADVKLHPVGELESYEAYRNIIESNSYKKINVIYGVEAEAISCRYKLIIIDFLLSGLNNHIFSLNVPVIIFNSDMSKLQIHGDHLSDLYQRCYIATNKDELRALLDRYKNGSLPSKWSEYFISKYIYPFEDVSPRVQITSYIDSII